MLFKAELHTIQLSVISSSNECLQYLTFNNELLSELFKTPLIQQQTYIWYTITQCNVGPWEIHLQSIWNSIFNIFNCPSSSLPVSVSKQVLGFGPCAFHCIRFLEIDPLLQYENMQYMAKVVPFYHKRTCGTENNKKYVFNTRIMKSRFSGSHQSIISQAAVLLHLLVWLASENCENRIVMMSFVIVNIARMAKLSK